MKICDIGREHMHAKLLCHWPRIDEDMQDKSKRIRIRIDNKKNDNDSISIIRMIIE